MTFTNVMSDTQPGEFDRRGNYFHGPLGSLLINRAGYEMRPSRRPSAAGRGPRRGTGRRGAGGGGPPPPPKMPFE